MSSFLAYCINTVGYLRLVTISDLVDIAILTFLFYKLIGLFRRTNAAKVARAVLLIVVAMWLAYQFNLHALNFLLSRAVELGFLALVIIFQPEIRRFWSGSAATMSLCSPATSGLRPPPATWSRPLTRRWKPMQRCRRTAWAP